MSTEPREFQLCKLHDGGGTVEYWFVEKRAYQAQEQKLAVAVETLGMVDAVGMSEPYAKIVKEALALINPTKPKTFDELLKGDLIDELISKDKKEMKEFAGALEKLVDTKLNPTPKKESNS